MKPEVSAEEALEEKEAKWAKAREVPAVDDESESYSYGEEENDCSVDWGSDDDADRRSRTLEGRQPAVESKGYLELEARIADPASASSTADIRPDPAGASGTAGAQADPASSAGRFGTADRRKAIEEDIKEHEAVVCPRCDAGNATWRLTCHRCGLERPNPKSMETHVAPIVIKRRARKKAKPKARRGVRHKTGGNRKLVGVSWFPEF